MGRRRLIAGPAMFMAAFLLVLAGSPGVTAGAITTSAPARPATVSAPAGLAQPRSGAPASDGQRQPAASAPAGPSVGILTDHGGPVMHNATAYALYWQPSGTFMSPNYKTLINRWFNDIGSNTTYNIVQQYGDGAGPPGLNVVFGGAWTDTAAFPNHEGGKANPITGQAVADEVIRALGANPGWADDLNHVVFVYLPEGVYLSGGPSSISFTNFCAYHFAYALTGETAVSHPVAAMPYVGTDPAHCGATNAGTPAAPNGDADADSEISTTSHEFFETVTDPGTDASGNDGWYYQDVNHEIGDQCNFVFGPFDPQGGDVVLNGHEYVMQTEWSNRATDPANPQVATGCVLSQPLASPFIYPTNGQAMADTTRPFTWSTVPGAQAYVVIVGTSIYHSDLLNSGVLPAGQTAFNMPSLPSGPTLYATLFTQVGGNWNYLPITFTAAPGQASFVYPINGQLNVDTTTPFSWTSIPGAQGYVVIVGTTVYGGDLGYSGVLGAGATSFNMPPLPSGPVLYATLFTEVNGSWARFQVMGFIAAPGRASFSYPVNGQQNVDTTKAFTWSTIPGAQAYLLAIGTALYSADLVNSGVLAANQSSFKVPALPTGRVLYALLFTEVNGAWNRYQVIGFIAH